MSLQIPVLPPRAYQLPIWNMLSGKLPIEVLIMMHRRIGKTIGILSWLSHRAITEKQSYLYLMKEHKQVRNGIWNGKMDDGRGIIETIFPKAIRSKTNKTDMSIELVNGSRIVFAGSNNIDGLIGSSQYIIVLDEFALYEDPLGVLGYLTPMVESSKGSIIMVSTPRYGSVFNEKMLKTINDNSIPHMLLDVHNSGAFSTGWIESKRAKAEAEGTLPYFQSEYELRLDAPLSTAYFTGLNDSSNDYVNTGKYYASWDLGMNDSTVITIFKYDYQRMLIVDMIEGKGQVASDYLSQIPYKIEKHFLPFDAKSVRGQVSTKSVASVFRGMGINIKVLPKTISVMDDINYVRTRIPDVDWFDTKPVNILKDKVKVYSPTLSDKPRHCDYTDSFRYGVLALQHIKEAIPVTPKPIYRGETSWM